MRVLVTRPDKLAVGLTEKINAMGDIAECFPVIEIKKTPHQITLQSAVNTLDKQDMAIFISQSAVQFSIPAIQSRWSTLPNLIWVAIGAGTADALQHLGIHPVLFPPAPPYESEALLALPQFQSLQGRRVSLFRGNGGRELLSKTLQARGALVQTIEVYQRCLPPLNPGMVEKIQNWRHTPLNVIVTTSAASLYNLVKLAENATGTLLGTLTETPIVVVGARMEKLAKDLNFKNPLMATSADDASIMRVLKTFKDIHG